MHVKASSGCLISKQSAPGRSGVTVTQRIKRARRSTPLLPALDACLLAAPWTWATTLGWDVDGDAQSVEPTTLPSTQPTDMGVLQIKGQFIKSLGLYRTTNLRTEWFTLESPSTEVRLRAGEYGCGRIELQEGSSPRLAGSAYGTSFRITAGQTTTLKIGGPLKPQVQAVPHGSVIDITFGLIGAGGEDYARADNQSPPQFIVTKGKRQIGAGTFEYG